MATKAYTDLEQSKKLAKILPLESADMRYFDSIPYLGYKKTTQDFYNKTKHEYLACWSLAALEHLIWNTSVDAVSCPHIYKNRIANGYYILYGNYETNICPSMVDACYELILKLHKLKLL